MSRQDAWRRGFFDQTTNASSVQNRKAESVRVLPSAMMKWTPSMAT